jgi:hypothetical protein
VGGQRHVSLDIPLKLAARAWRPLRCGNLTAAARERWASNHVAELLVDFLLVYVKAPAT